jgi:hypothetical protein
MSPQEQRLVAAMAALSQQLYDLYDAPTPLTDTAIIHLSQQLDALILEWYRVADDPTKLEQGRREE